VLTFVVNKCRIQAPGRLRVFALQSVPCFSSLASTKLLAHSLRSAVGFGTGSVAFFRMEPIPFMVPVLKNFVLPHATPIAFLVAYGELAIGLALVLGILVRPASICGVIYMFTLLFSANYPGPHAAFWQYFGASLEHLVLALCLASFASTNPQEILSIRTYLRSRPSV
jgi:uncharacterized membrane protein YphA (DoxX/SURF4 family)